jgi:hypothetical protein
VSGRTDDETRENEEATIMVHDELARIRIDELLAEAERERLARSSRGEESRPTRPRTFATSARGWALVALLVSLSGWVLGIPGLALIS